MKTTVFEYGVTKRRSPFFVRLLRWIFIAPPLVLTQSPVSEDELRACIKLVEQAKQRGEKTHG